MKKEIVIKYTEDYSIFKNIGGNRPIDEKHVKRLMREFKRERLLEPIKINTKAEVIDGQHGLEAAKRLGMGVWYYCVGDYELRHVPKYNSTTLQWSRRHFLNSFCKLGVTPYLKLDEFMKTYPEFGIATAAYILSGGEEMANGQRIDDFKNGKYVVSDVRKGHEYAAMLCEYKEFYRGYNRSSFVRTMIPLFKNHRFSHEKFLRKLSADRTALVDCSTIERYRDLIEKIYNKNSQNKINLRYVK